MGDLTVETKNRNINIEISEIDSDKEIYIGIKDHFNKEEVSTYLDIHQAEQIINYLKEQFGL